MFKLPKIIVPVIVFAIYIDSLGINAEIIPLTTILPKLQAIHQDAQSLLKKNSELKTEILTGLQAQGEAKLLQVKNSSDNQKQPSLKAVDLNGQKLDEKRIDYVELEEFNKWVTTNLEYAVKNTQATIEALKDEANSNSGSVDYTEQAIKDGIEGVKYWQSAVIFQDKTLKNEKFEAD